MKRNLSIHESITIRIDWDPRNKRWIVTGTFNSGDRVVDPSVLVKYVQHSGAPDAAARGLLMLKVVAEIESWLF